MTAPTAFVSRPTVDADAAWARHMDAKDRADGERAAHDRAREAQFEAHLAAFRRTSAFLKAELEAREAEEGSPVNDATP